MGLIGAVGTALVYGGRVLNHRHELVDRLRGMGIVGMGRIGRAVARRATAFGITVRCHDRDRVGAIVMLHIPRKLRLADPLNQRQLVELRHGGMQWPSPPATHSRDA